MRIRLCALASGLLLLPLLLQHTQAQSGVATVDLQKVFNDYWKKKAAEKAINAQAADLEQEARAMLESLRKAKEEAQALLSSANDQAAAPEEREKRKQAAEQKLKQVRETEENLVAYERQARATLDEQRQRVRVKILKDVTDVVCVKAKAGGFSLVLNSGSQADAGADFSSLPAILYTNHKHDLSDAVLTELNATAPPPFSSPGQEHSSEKEVKNGLGKPDDQKPVP